MLIRAGIIQLPKLVAGLLAALLLLGAGCGGTSQTPTPTPIPDPKPTLLPKTLSERETLVTLYHATNGPDWTDNTYWLTDRPVGEWYGVVADSDGRVTELDLSDNGLSGEIPPELGNLARLTSLRLNRNQLSGAIPSELGNLVNLAELRLAGNRSIGGEIPPELGNLANLTLLALGGSQLGGEIPPELGNLASLTSLNLSGNQLSGEIPPELADLANLTSLVLASNQLSGEIPPELGNLTNLTRLLLHINQLSGGIPPELAELANLESLSLSDNPLGGEIPRELGSLTNLTHLMLDDNRLSGHMPPELGNLSNLTQLRLTDNQLSGEIPQGLDNLANLTHLMLGDNQLSGEIPRELGTLANLTQLLLNDNQLTGEIPPELGSLANLTHLRLQGNQLIGKIPPELGSLSKLTELVLAWNQLIGEIPPELGSLSNLTELKLSGNQLSGEIPPELAGLVNLTELWLHTNLLIGKIPPELGNLTNLISLRLGHNHLIGEIPPELGSLSNLTSLWLQDNRLSGEIPPELGNLSNLIDLQFTGNQLIGEIPPELGNTMPVRVATDIETSGPPGALPTVSLEAVFGGRQFDSPVEIGTYPVGPVSGTGPGAFVADQEGRILLLHPDSDEAVELLDISARVSRMAEEEGLLSVALDPRFEETGHLWLYYSVEGLPRKTRLSRFAADLGDLRRVDPGSELVVLEVSQPDENHNGGSIRFGPDGMLFLGLGDGGLADEGQKIGTLLGSVIRIDVREVSEVSPYAVPPDNPFVGVPGARPEIWAYGFRNPWRMAFDPATGALWAGDVGHLDIEEIDRIEAGGNYGWNRFEGTRCINRRLGCDSDGFVLPVAEYGHHLGCAVTGGLVYRGKAIPALVGHYLFSDFCRGQLWALPLEGGNVVEVAAIPRPVSSFGVDADGEVYVLTFRGAALRIVPP